MNLRTLAASAVFGLTLISCGEPDVVPAPCPADGRLVTVWLNIPAEGNSNFTGKFTGWNQYWITLDDAKGPIRHFATDTVFRIDDLGNQ